MKKTTVVRAVAENIADDANELDLGGLCRGFVVDQIEYGILNFLKSLTVEVGDEQ